MYLRTALLLGIAAIALAGCTNSASTSSLPSQSPTTVKFTGPPAAKATPIPRDAVSSARAAAAQFDSIYYASKFAASWHLLSADARRAIPERVWVRVHDGCRSGQTSVTSVIKAVTVFGDAAIVTETLTTQAKRSTAENVFNYANGRWGYSPENLSIYHHGSVSADIAAARAAGLCASQQPFLPNKGLAYEQNYIPLSAPIPAGVSRAPLSAFSGQSGSFPHRSACSGVHCGRDLPLTVAATSVKSERAKHANLARRQLFL